MNDYYSILGVSREANATEITVNYRNKLMEKFRETGYGLALSEIKNAYHTLANPDKRRAYDQALEKVVGRYIIKNPDNPSPADKKYLNGLASMDHKNFQTAVDLFTQAIKLDPENCHYYSQLGLALGMFPGSLSEGERFCKKAIEFEPDNPELCYNLGFLYQRHNLVDAAQQAFLQAQQAEQVRWGRYFCSNQKAIELLWRGVETIKINMMVSEQSAIQEPIQTVEDHRSDEKPIEMESASLAKSEPMTVETEINVEAYQITKAMESDDEKIKPDYEEAVKEAAPKEPEQTPEEAKLSRSETQEDISEPIILNDGDFPEPMDMGQLAKISTPIKESGPTPIATGDLDTDDQIVMAHVLEDEMDHISTEVVKQQLSGQVAAEEKEPETEELHSEISEEHDLLKDLALLEEELSSIESLSGLGSGDNDLLLEMKTNKETPFPPPPDTATLNSGDMSGGAKQKIEENIDLSGLQDEALNLLKELGVETSTASAEDVNAKESVE
jgi:tetratricopeptide (TPR) repeat protein